MIVKLLVSALRPKRGLLFDKGLGGSQPFHVFHFLTYLDRLTLIKLLGGAAVGEKLGQE
jgi:hypothetical protein